jgi:DNA-binding CsgD family transcriptional regulator/sugar-specific transcriptional regulator TrmB
MLEALGMGHEAELVYRTILEHPTWGVAEVAAHLDWHDANVRTAMDTLADLRLLRPSPGNPGQLRPVSPQVGLAALLVRSEAELNRRQSQIETSRAAVAALAAEYGVGADYAPEVMERLEGNEAVRNRLGELMDAAKAECLSFQPGAQQPETREAGRPLVQDALERGIKLRAIRQEIFRNDPLTLTYVRWNTSLGGQTRTVPALPMRLVVIDWQCALVPLDPNDSSRGALELRSPGAVAAMRALFEQFWSIATPWDEKAPQRDQNGLSRRELELLKLLAAGHTDEVVGRKLGLSLRTIRRMTSDLMERLDAQSRFQAGVNAVQRHWL